MFPSLAAALLLLELPLCAIAKTSSDLGILQLVTPTTHAAQVPATAIATLSADAISFCSSYIDVDTFHFQSAIVNAALSGGASLLADQGVLATIYFDATTSLLENPTAYLSRLSASATPFPLFSSQLMSQASGILLGYQSLVSEDILSKTPSQAVTPGMSIKVDGATAAAGGQATGATGATATAQSTSSFKALGVPVATANSHLMYGCGAAAAAGLLGMVLL